MKGINKETIYLIVLAFVTTFLLITFVQKKKLEKTVDKVQKELSKIESIKDQTILIDSVNYETVEEIWKKDIVIYDTLITDSRTLYLVDKYK